MGQVQRPGRGRQAGQQATLAGGLGSGGWASPVVPRSAVLGYHRGRFRRPSGDFQIKIKLYNFRATLSFLVLAAALTTPLSGPRAQTAPTDQIADIFGLSLASKEPLSLNIATRYGLLRAGPDGMATLVPGLKAALTSLAVHPGDFRKLLVSGYAPKGVGLGVMMSPDGGESWTRISKEGGGQGVFHAMDISRSDPNTIYGASKELQVSRDGGRSWKIVGKPPGELIDLALSSLKSDTLYAATKEGLFFSRDGGASWNPGHPVSRPATMVHAAAGGRLYAFVFGVGLITAKEPSLAWKTLSKDFADRYFLHMTVDPDDPKRLYATVDTGAIMISGDGGRKWTSFEGSHAASAENTAKGKRLYEDSCQVCHGVGGIGESPGDPSAEDEYGFKAPALNNDAHAWHHSDQNLTTSILNGSPRNARMIAFKDILSGADVENLIAHIKSLWNFRSLACQGARHMACMGN